MNEYKTKFKTWKFDQFKKTLYDFEPDIECLENACLLRGNIKILRALINDFVIIPNQQCLENVCKKNDYSYNRVSVKYLMDYVIPNTKCLEIVCTLKRCENLQKLMIESGIEPNIKCLELACTNSSEFIQKRIIESGVKPNIKCLRNICSHNINKVVITNFLDNLENNIV
jgi:hypothetical protein